MLLPDETEAKYGYTIESLSTGSNKPILLRCDYCNDTFECTPKRWRKGNELINKDACKKCRYKKRDELGILKWGATNPFAREDVKEKIKSNNLEKYGVEHWVETEEFKSKAKETNLERYGTEHAMQSEEIQEKIRETNLKKYGVEYTTQVKEFQDKAKKTCLEKFGAENFFGSEAAKKLPRPIVLNRRRGKNHYLSTPEGKAEYCRKNIEKYGAAYPMLSSLARNNTRITNLKKYGVECVFQSERIKERIKQTNIKRYGTEYATQNAEVKARSLATSIANGHTKVFDNKTMLEWSDELEKAYTTFVLHVRKFGFEEAIKIKAHINALEAVFENWLVNENISYKKHYQVENRYCDFFLNDKLIVELDGLFWHGDLVIKDNKYHFDKKDTYIRNGLDSVFFREDEVNNKFDIVKSIIRNKLGFSQRIFARKCSLQMVAPHISKLFFKDNHLMGAGRGYTYGLYFENKLVSAIQVKRRHHHTYEISRFASLKGLNIVGGFSKLVSYVEKQHPIEILKTFIDRRYGVGNYLYNMGFQKEAMHPSFQWVIGGETVHRMQFPNQTGYDHGAFKIWDCGQIAMAKTVRK